MSKADLVDADRVEQVRQRLAEVAPGVPVFDAKSPSAAAAFLNIGTRRPGGVDDLPTPSLFDVHTTSTIPVPDPIAIEDLQRLVDNLDPDTLRAKGIARDADGALQLVQVVGKRRLITPLPFAEDQATTDLVVISATE